MAKTRRWVANRNLKVPYTRMSRYRKKSYIKSKPQIKVVKFELGNLSKEYAYRARLRCKNIGQVRHNALEAARQTSNRVMDKAIGKTNYKLKIILFPHHIVREHYQAAVAQADRISSGMAHSFGKPSSLAVQLKKPNKYIMEIYYDNPKDEAHARLALKRAASKMPFRFTVDIEKLK